MLFGDVIAIALSIIGFLLSLQGLWLVAHALWPLRVEITTRQCGRSALACFGAGLPVTLVAAFFAAMVARTGTFGQVSAFGVGLLYIVYANVGVAGLVTHIGRRLTSPADAQQPWKATVRGGIALELAWLIPVVGWIGLLGITLILGAGAMTLSFFSSAGRPTALALSAPGTGAPTPVPAIAGTPSAPAPVSRAQRPRPIPAATTESPELVPAHAVGVE